MNTHNDWSWKPSQADKERLRLANKRLKRKKKNSRAKYMAKLERLERRAAKQESAEFYKSWEWKKARFETVARWGAQCQCCGSEWQIVVDHIKPRSKFPELQLARDNLQVLCRECNMGKSNDDYTDFRPKISNSDIAELEIIKNSNDRI